MKRSRNSRKAPNDETVVKNIDARHPKVAPTKPRTLKLVIVPKGMAVLNTPIAIPSSLCINHLESSWGRTTAI
ncbi:MAG: hypothetical protein QW589_05895, partial [Candidatus Bathyarchaeia archaeon]